MSCVLISELVALDEAVELVSPINWINTTLEATKAAIAIATMIRVERFFVTTPAPGLVSISSRPVRCLRTRASWNLPCDGRSLGTDLRL